MNMQTKFQKIFSKEKIKLEKDVLYIGDQEVMNRWETPLMEKMADFVSGPGKDVLEIGFGLGISADFIQKFGCKSHTILEIHPEVYKLALDWSKKKSVDILNIDFSVYPLKYKNKFDGILLDVFPLAHPNLFPLMYSKNMKPETVFVPFGLFNEKEIDSAYKECNYFFRKSKIVRITKTELKGSPIKNDAYFKVFSEPVEEVLNLRKN